MSVQQFDSNGDPITIPDAVASPDQQVADTTGTLINPAKEDGNLLSVKTNTDKLDVNLSTRASEATLSTASSTLTGIKGKTDQLTFSGTALTIDGSATTQPISALSLPLPTGASTEATLSSLNTKVVTTVNGIKVDGSAAIQPISATSLPLPTGASTEATLSSLNSKDFATETTLSSLNSKDFATQTTLSSIKTDTGNLDVFLSTRASETNLTSVKTKLSDGTQKTQLVDGVGNVVGSTGNALDVNIKSGVTIDVSLDHSSDNVLVYGNDGTTDQKIKTDASGNVQVGGSVSASQSGAWSVSVNNFPATQPVSGTVAATQSGAWTVAATQSGGWTVTANAGTGTFTVGGTVTANIGTTNGLALDATLTGGSQKTKLVDSAGTNVATISATGALKVDGSAVIQPVSQSGTWSVRIQDGSGNAITSSSVNSRQAVDIHQADTSFIVSGLTAVGSAPSLNPVSVSGVDGGGLKRAILTDTAGATVVTGKNASGVTATSNPVLIGGKDDVGLAQVITADDLAGAEWLYTLALPVQADFVKDLTYYSVIVEFTLPSGNTESPMLLIKNPSGNTKVVYLDDMQMDVITKGQQAICRLYSDPTSTANGTGVTISNCNIGGGAPASTMQAFSGPTITANGTKFRAFSVGTNSNSTVVQTNFGILLQPNHTLLITGTPTANNVITAFSIRWAEVAL